MVNLKGGNGSNARKTVKAAVKASTEDHELADAIPQSFADNIVDEASPSDGGGSRTWCSPVRIPCDGGGQVWNFVERGRPAERRPQKVDRKRIREEPSAGWAGGLQRAIERHVLCGSTGCVRLHEKLAKR